MTTLSLQQYIGKTGDYWENKLLFKVKILDARDRGWGYIDFLITPVAGSGTVWVEKKRVRIDE